MQQLILRDGVAGQRFQLLNTHFGLTSEERTVQSQFLVKQLEEAKLPTIVCGDFNVAPEDRDVCNPEFWASQTLFHVDAFKTVDTTWSRETFKQFWGFLFASTTVLGLILPYILAYFLRASRGVLHIARDVVDHQYTPRLSFARWMLPKGSRREGIHPRRVRLQNRLHALMSEVIKPGNFDRLVFVTHSQGTVIMHDYLTSKRDEAELRDVKHIDVITLASPLSHIYQHYFHDYERATRPAARLSPRLRSWTNLWRIDDPIGQRVDIVLDDFISNVALGPGGHVNYWKENEVCEAILNAIDPARAKASSSVASPQEQQARTPAGPRLFEVTS